MRLGILGGTFNPPHLGHLVCAQEAYRELGLDRVMLIPARIPPHKPVEHEPGPEPPPGALKPGLAVDADDRFEVSDIELRRDGPSYTVDTLKELTSTKHPNTEHFLMRRRRISPVGLPRMAASPRRVLELATLAIAKAAVAPARSSVASLRSTNWPTTSERAEFFQMPRIGVSSTMIRRRVRAGQPIRLHWSVPDRGWPTYIDRADELYAQGGRDEPR